MSQLVLSLFPGIGMLDHAFELEGFTVVRGPDLDLTGWDIRDFQVIRDRFDGVIGGPPCKGESTMAHLNGTPGETLVHEFDRVVADAQPKWWVMEAVKEHSFHGHVLKLNNRWIGESQNRIRYFHSDLNLQPHIQLAPLESQKYHRAVLAGHGPAEGTTVNGITKYSLPDACELQGLPRDYCPKFLTKAGLREAVGNGVPIPMGRAVARAVLKAID